MGLLDKLWDDVFAGPQPDKGLSRLRHGKVRENVWRSVFHPGSNKAMQKIGSAKFDKPDPQSPTSVYDWLYSGETKSKWR